MRTFIVNFHGHGWVWSQTFTADSAEEAEAIAEKTLGKGEIITYIEEA